MKGKRRRGRQNLWAIPAAIMALLLAAIFRPEIRSLFGSGDETAVTPVSDNDSAAGAPSDGPDGSGPSPPPPNSSPSNSVAAHIPKPSADGSAAAASSQAPTTAPPPNPAGAAVRPAKIDGKVDGKDAKTWQAMLHGAVMRHDAANAADAFIALSELDPGRFSVRRTRHDAVTAVHLAASATKEISDRVFEILAGDALGHLACDILYRLTSVHGGSRAAKRAAQLLNNKAVLARATPAMRIALSIRDTACRSRPALFKQASREGDQRALYLLQTMVGDHCGQISCCMRTDSKLKQTIGAIRSRIAAAR